MEVKERRGRKARPETDTGTNALWKWSEASSSVNWLIGTHNLTCVAPLYLEKYYGVLVSYDNLRATGVSIRKSSSLTQIEMALMPSIGAQFEHETTQPTNKDQTL